jgi:hypothetical protein
VEENEAAFMSDQESDRREVLALGSDIVGGIAGGVLGFLVAGATGAILGGATGPLVKRAFGDFLERALSHKEKARVGGAAAVAIQRYEENLKLGMAPRTDLTEDSQASRAELTEGVLQKARNSYQEKKVRLLGNILANFHFIPGLSVDDGQEILNVVDELSHRQLLILESLRLDEQRNWQTSNYRGVPLNLPKIALLQEIYDLAIRGLVICKKDDAEMATFLLGWHDVAPYDLRLTAIGQLVVSLIGPDASVEADRAVISQFLSVRR